MASKKKESTLVPVQIFRDSGKYSEDVTVGLNGKIYRVRRGETVLVPREIREILDHSKYQDETTSKMILRMQDESIGKERLYNN